MQYEIIQTQKCKCRVLGFELKKNHYNNSDFLVAMLGKYDTGDFLCSVISNKAISMQNELQTSINKKTPYTIDRIAIKPYNCVYHKLTWDDVRKKVCDYKHVGEIQRDFEGNPILWKQIVVYTNINGCNFPNVNEILDKEYIEVNSPFVQAWLDYINPFSYNRGSRHHNIIEDYGEYNNDYCDSDMTDEERVMAALENGYGEYYGY